MLVKNLTLSTDVVIDVSKIELSVYNLSSELSSLELSVSGISGIVDNLSTALSTAISSKIWIKDIGALTGSKFLNGTASDLSIIKISKDEYDTLVEDPNKVLCSNVLYVVSADYIDAYSQVISNLTMTDDEYPTEATNKHYVDTLVADKVTKDNTTYNLNNYTLGQYLSVLTKTLGGDIEKTIG